MKQLLLTFIAFIYCSVLFAQKFRGQYNVTLGAGFHNSQYLQKTYNNTFKPKDLKTPAIILYAINFDYGLSDRFSIGLSTSSFSVKSTYTGFTNTTGQAVVESGSDIYKASDLGLRILYHTGLNDDFDPYFGGKLGYTFQGFSTTSNHGFISETLRKEMNKPISPQLLAGFKYYFTEHLGMNVELALGRSYTGLLGITYRGGGN